MKKMLMLKHQSRFMQMPFKFPHIRWFFLVAGYGSGKTRAEVMACLHDVKRLQHKKDRAGDFARLMVCGYTLSHLEKTFLIYFRQLLDESKTPYREDKKYNLFKIGTVTVILQPLENPGNIFGIDVHKIYAEEADELPTDKLLEAARALNERCRQVIVGERSPCINFASTAQGTAGLYALYVHFKKSGVGFALLRARTQDNPFLPKEMIEHMLKTYTKDEQLVYMAGEFISIAKGRVIPGFSWDKNYLSFDLDDKLRIGDRVWIGHDVNQGFSRGSAYIVRDGIIYCIKYYDFADIMDAPSVFRHDFPLQTILWIPDVTIKDSFPAYARELRKHDIKIIYRKKSPLVEDSCFLVSKLFYLERLMVCKIAKDVAEACDLAKRDKDNKIPSGKGVSSPIHTIDGIRYACVFIVATHPDFQDIRKIIVEKRASLREGNTEEEEIKKLSGGYSEINPNAFIK